MTDYNSSRIMAETPICQTRKKTPLTFANLGLAYLVVNGKPIKVNLLRVMTKSISSIPYLVSSCW